MNIELGICAIAYNGYGKYVKGLLENINKMSPKPKQVTIVLGRGHGCEDSIETLSKAFSRLVVIKDDKAPTMGRLRNVAVANTPTEWIMYVSVDDLIERTAIRTFSQYADYDYICASWYKVDLKGEITGHSSVTPYTYYKNQSKLREDGRRRKGGFIIGHSPYKRWLWEKTKYPEHDYPNSPFVLGCVLNKAKFVRCEKPTTTYVKHEGSHSLTTLLIKTEKRKANLYKGEFEKGIKSYYEQRRIERRRRAKRCRRCEINRQAKNPATDMGAK